MQKLNQFHDKNKDLFFIYFTNTYIERNEELMIKKYADLIVPHHCGAILVFKDVLVLLLPD